MVKISYIILVVLTIILDMWALFSLLKKKNKGVLWWIIIILALPAIGAIVYFQLERNKKRCNY